MSLFSTPSIADVLPESSVAPQDHSVESYQDINKVVETVVNKKLSTDLPSESTAPKLSKEEIKLILSKILKSLNSF